ncbi:(deoxy)nucleoside triphosphate pyrophosphohydrolase [Streptacidiphilus sp. N1-12]|uniref:(Deoxy)nucleoside triphosphate pyrophosphohydrolase n=2 Tax=Streptacidiphilus alkalitolerans TaxID=3342712 RepID=A0ABV6WLY9_9ACTN
MDQHTALPASRTVAPRIVVGGALIAGGRVLAARRSAPAETAGRWEFPGGKAEAGETPPEALVRELREELGVEARALARIPGAWPVRADLELQIWTAELLSGTPAPLQDHSELRWLSAAELDRVDWLDQDRFALPAVARLLAAAEAALDPAAPDPAAPGPAPDPAAT